MNARVMTATAVTVGVIALGIVGLSTPEEATAPATGPTGDAPLLQPEGWQATPARRHDEGDAVWRPLVIPPTPGVGGPSLPDDAPLPADVMGIELLMASREEVVRACASTHHPDARGTKVIVVDFTLSADAAGARITGMRGRFDEDELFSAWLLCVQAALADVVLQPTQAESVVSWPLRL